MTPVDAAELERIVDRYQLAHVIELLAYLCYRKAMHLGSNRKEKALSDEWCKAGRTLEHLVTNRSIRATSNYH
jgi:hypothetical protein